MKRVKLFDTEEERREAECNIQVRRMVRWALDAYEAVSVFRTNSEPAIATSSLAEILHVLLLRGDGLLQFLDLIRQCLQDEQKTLKQLPVTQRVAIARGLLTALSLTIKDLEPIGTQFGASRSIRS